MPSRSEAFGLAALEGMAYGRPVVHFDLPTLDWMSGDVAVRAVRHQRPGRRVANWPPTGAAGRPAALRAPLPVSSGGRMAERYRTLSGSFSARRAVPAGGAPDPLGASPQTPRPGSPQGPTARKLPAGADGAGAASSPAPWRAAWCGRTSMNADPL